MYWEGNNFFRKAWLSSSEAVLGLYHHHDIYTSVFGERDLYKSRESGITFFPFPGMTKYLKL